MKKSILINSQVHYKLKDHCKRNNLSMSAFVESLILREAYQDVLEKSSEYKSFWKKVNKLVKKGNPSEEEFKALHKKQKRFLEEFDKKWVNNTYND